MIHKKPPNDCSAPVRRAPAGWMRLPTTSSGGRGAASLRRTLRLWALSQTEAAKLFRVSRQALHKWLAHGIPADRAETVADLAAATDLLDHYLQRDRIPAVVRRSAPELGGQSLMGLLQSDGGHAVLMACRKMFDFSRI